MNQPMKYISSPLKYFALIFLAFLACYSQSMAASYDVLMVSGEILYEGSGENLTAGTVLASGERIQFKDKESFAVLIGEGGRFTLTAANLGSKYRSGQYVTVKSATKNGKSGLEARVKPEFKSEKDIVDFLGGAAFLLLRELELKIPAKSLNLNADSQFILRIKKAGEIVAVTKRLTYEKGTLIINGGDIASAGDASMLSDHTLMVFRAVGQPMQQITTLDLVIVEEGGPMRNEISKLIELLRTALGEDGMEQEVMKQNVLDYLIEYYGTPEKEDFENWVIEYL
jgi:hypothetical protein